MTKTETWFQIPVKINTKFNHNQSKRCWDQEARGAGRCSNPLTVLWQQVISVKTIMMMLQDDHGTTGAQ